MSEIFYVNFSSLVQWFLRRRLLKHFKIFSLCENSSPIVAPLEILGGGHDFNKPPFSLFHKDFMYFSLGFSEPMVPEKIFKMFPYINGCKNSFPYCGPIRPTGAMILTNVLVYYVRKLSYKFQLF
jgi:hypothetical protein